MFGVNSLVVDSSIGDNRIWLAVVGSSIAGKRSAASSVTFGVTKGLCSPWEELDPPMVEFIRSGGCERTGVWMGVLVGNRG